LDNTGNVMRDYTSPFWYTTERSDLQVLIISKPAEA
jgi:hypothetical protein